MHPYNSISGRCLDIFEGTYKLSKFCWLMDNILMKEEAAFSPVTFALLDKY